MPKREALKKEIMSRLSAGETAVRFQSLFGDARAGLRFDETGRFTGFDANTADDLREFFAVLKEARDEIRLGTPDADINFIVTLFSFEICDGKMEDGMGIGIGEHPELFTVGNAAQLVTQLSAMLAPYAADYVTFDLFNEPGNAREVTDEARTREIIKNYIGPMIAAMHANNALVTVGVWKDDTLFDADREHISGLWKEVCDEVDAIQFHMYGTIVEILNRIDRLPDAKQFDKPVFVGLGGKNPYSDRQGNRHRHRSS